MSKLEELIQQYCPDGVEYKKLEGVCGFITGFAFKAALFREEGEPICKTTNIQGDIVDFTDMQCFHLDEYDINLDKYIIYPQDIVIGMSGTIKVGINNSTEKCYLNQRVGKFIPERTVLDNKFLYYVLLNNVEALSDGIGGGSVKNLSNNDINNLQIPVPPLPVQEEIVRILDSFTELQAELQAELQKRLQQYNYYRDNLLSFEGRTDVEWKKLGEVAKIGDGLHGTPHYSSNTGYFFINGNNLRNGVIVCDENTKQISEEEYEKIKVELDDNTLLMSINGTVGNMAFYKGEHIALGKSAAYFRVNPHFISKSYLYYYLQSGQAHSYYNLVLTGSTIKNLGLKSLREMAIPVPSLSEQQCIVDILDRFDTLTNDITAGLPAEIEARRKQYEYYRDQLLTFKHKA